MMLTKKTIWIDNSHHITAIDITHGGKRMWYAYTLYSGAEGDRVPLARWDRDGNSSRVMAYPPGRGEPRFIQTYRDVELPYVLEMARSFGDAVAELPSDILTGEPS